MSDKNLNLSDAPMELAPLITVQPGAVVSRVLLNKSAGTLTLFAFDAGEGLSDHTAPFDALVQVLEGEAAIHIGTREHAVRAGHILLLPANIPHALHARAAFKMLLTMIRV